MSVLVNTQNEQEDSFLTEYDNELCLADLDIEAGNYDSHENVEIFFRQRREAL